MLTAKLYLELLSSFFLYVEPHILFCITKSPFLSYFSYFFFPDITAVFCPLPNLHCKSLRVIRRASSQLWQFLIIHACVITFWFCMHQNHLRATFHQLFKVTCYTVWTKAIVFLHVRGCHFSVFFFMQTNHKQCAISISFFNILLFGPIESDFRLRLIFWCHCLQFIHVKLTQVSLSLHS